MRFHGWFLVSLILTATGAMAQTTVQVPVPPVNITIPAGCVLSGTMVTCPPPINNRTKLVPSGSNDEATIYSAAAKGPIELGCPAGATTCTFTQTPISFPANTDLLCDDSVTVSDMPGFTSYQVLWQANAANVKLAASTDARSDPNACKLTMPNAFKANSTNTNQSTNQYNHCFQSYMASNVSLTGFAFANCGGDSIYIQFSTNVTINGVRSTTPIRNGLSATDQNANVLIENSSFNGAQNLKIAGIADGVDVEPNGTAQGVPLPGAFVNGVTLKNVTATGNARSGVCLCLWWMAPTTPVTVTLTGVTATGNGMFAFEQNGTAYLGVTGSGNTPAFP